MMQADKVNNQATILSSGMRMFLGWLNISSFLIIIAGAISIPFYFESSTMLYKFGADKTLLRSGKVIGLIAACLVILQSVLSARFKYMDRIFALNNLMNAHQICGMVIAGCAIIHPVLIFIPEDMISVPVSFRYWPEYAGVFLLLLILGIVMAAVLRTRIGLSYDRWRTMHQWAVFFAAVVLFVHVLFVSETFETGMPRVIVFCVIGFYAVVFSWIRVKPFVIKKNGFSVLSINSPAKDTFCLKIEPDSGKIPSWLPGQFGFVSVKSDTITSEAHPFTIASSPLQPGSLEFVIRSCGDWTKKIGNVKHGDPVYVDGPFGLFTHLRCRPEKEIIMIAGGIGITPMLSMLRYMKNIGDPRKITLVWSNRTRENIVFAHEFELFEKKLSNLQVVHVFTEDPAGNKENKQLYQSGLDSLLLNCSRLSAVFVCGPPKMMKDIRKALVRIGFSRRSIFMERFGL